MGDAKASRNIKHLRDKLVMVRTQIGMCAGGDFTWLGNADVLLVDVIADLDARCLYPDAYVADEAPLVPPRVWSGCYESLYYEVVRCLGRVPVKVMIARQKDPDGWNTVSVDAFLPPGGWSTVVELPLKMFQVEDMTPEAWLEMSPEAIAAFEAAERRALVDTAAILAATGAFEL